MEAEKMKLKKVVTIVLVAASAASMSVGVMAAGSITNAVDTNKVTAEQSTGSTAGKVGDLNAEVETVGATLTKNVEGLYEEEIQKAVDALNKADKNTTVKDAFFSIYGEEEMPEISLIKIDGTVKENVNLSEYKFISPMMDLKFEEGVEATEKNPVDVTFTANNMTDEIQVDVLHYCEEHNWEILEGEKVSENQIKASFHSASPIALIYRELPEEETEVDTDVVAP